MKLLKEPDLMSPQNSEALKMFEEDRPRFDQKAREWAVKFAGASIIENDYGGYSRDLVQRFVDMGFRIVAVVEAFKYVGIDRNNGLDYTLEEAYEGDILAKLYDA
ncbi:hypothetical protein FVEN_g117 [Fusarium venenatum]|uniref:UBC core domain-containing protein n=1 Tax=Fusarium venenatum TaxID=56646 RepID=A0A2L2T6G9_9HYPO|nr:uncharacterized protein FVRRES_07789 [Fusarium venenatum]KAG8362487.1 hypothetical protein FVEN_g117 [Fusarium venenatum]CEI63353.1 unnamed protein product [Fusarium venenatum]